MNKLVLVHLSDIHFTRSSGASVYDLDADLRNELLRDVSRLSKGLGGATGVLVTGDIAYSGQRAEYEIAAAWLADLCRAVGCPEENVWVVPGNHDVDRKVAGNKVTKSLQEGIRNKIEARIDAELREVLSDPQSAGASRRSPSTTGSPRASSAPSLRRSRFGSATSCSTAGPAFGCAGSRARSYRTRTT